MNVKKWICTGWMLLGWAVAGFSQSAIIEFLLSAEQLSEDLDSLHAILWHTHSDPFAYTTPEALEEQFEVVRYAVREGMTATEFYKLINPIFLQLRDIHSRLYVARRYNGYALNGGYYLPMRIRYLEGKIWVEATKDSILSRGSEVLSVNEIPAAEIARQLLAQSYTDGEIAHTRERVMEEEFFALFPLFFPVDRKNTLSYVAPGTTDTLEIALNGIRLIGSREEMKERKKRQKKAAQAEDAPFVIEIDAPESTAILRIASFSEGSAARYDRFLRQSFASIHAEGIRHLVIDLRGNRGGFINRGTELVAYLTDEPFPYISHSIVRSSPLLRHKIRRGILFPGLMIALFRGSIGREIVAAWENPAGIMDTLYWEPIVPQKPKRRFDGDVYLLVDGLSISNSSLVHHAIKSNRLGLSIGTPCGGTANGTFGNSADFMLPHSRISGKISTIRILSAQEDTSYLKDALPPDYFVPLTVEDFIRQRDPQLDFARELIRQKVALEE